MLRLESMLGDSGVQSLRKKREECMLQDLHCWTQQGDRAVRGSLGPRFTPGFKIGVKVELFQMEGRG